MGDRKSKIEAELQGLKDTNEKADLLNDLSWELKLSDPRRGLEIASQANALSRQLSYAHGLARSACCRGINYIYLSDFKQAVGDLETALELFGESGDKDGQALTQNWMGNAYFKLNDYNKSLHHHLNSLQLRKELDDLSGESRSLHNIGNIYLELGDYELSLEYYIKSLNIDEKLSDDDGIAINLNGIGLVYGALGDNQKAIECHCKTDSIFAKNGDRNGKLISTNNIGNIYLELKEYQKAMECYDESLTISDELDEKYVRANSLLGLGKINQILNNSGLALEYYLKALDISVGLGNKETQTSILLSLGDFYRQTGNIKEERRILDRSLEIAGEINSKPKLSASHLALSQMYAKMDDCQRALEHYQKYHDCDKQIFNESSDKKRQASMIRFQVEQKEKEAEIYRLRNVELAEANQAITQAKEIIEEKNRHITSSIEYARRIQQAVLPPAGKMQAALPEHFVLFKPRDIVSGDFYWFSQTGGKILIAVVDCTGHGVPGAFMSMIGSMLLNTIVNENGETGPAKVLEQLHVAVRSALKQHDAEADTTDGMDVSLCAIEPGSRRLVYAGAKRPLYLVRNNELTEIAGDGKSIGGRQKEEKRAFSDKQIALQRGDMIYLTSDGYADQCDAEGRKIGSRRLKELLVEISGQYPADQREALLAELKRHQGAEEQRDDIAVVGVTVS